MTGNKSVAVDIVSDLVCPWCWVGLRNLQAAAKESNIEAVVTWHPFMLRPDRPLEGVDKGGTPESRAGSRMRQVGQSVGINFTGLTDKYPNTSLFHATIKHLQETKMDWTTITEFHEAVFEGYFTLGEFPNEAGILKAASRVSDPKVADSVSRLYDDTARLEDLRRVVYKEAEHASRQGVSGVPTFRFNGHVAFSGAQPVDSFVRQLQQHHAK